MNVRVKHPLVEIDKDDREPEPFLTAEQSSFDVTTLLRILHARKSIIIGTVVAGLALTLGALALIVPTYSASAVMILDQRKNTVADVNAVLSGLPTDPVSVQNQIQVLASRQLALRVVDKLGLDRDPEFNSELSSGLLGALTWSSAAEPTSQLPLSNVKISKGREAAMGRLQKRLSVEQMGLSTAMTISVASVDPVKSAKITNAVADAYVEDQLNAKFEATQKATKWLSGRVRQMSEQLQAAEAAVQDYKAKHGIVDTAGGGSIVDQQTASVSVQLINSRADLAQKVALYERTIELQRTGRAVEAAQVVASPLIAQLRAQESELQRQEAQLSSRYLPQHPKMVDVQSQKRETRSKIAGEVSRVIDSLANDVAVGRANVRSLEGSLEQLQSKFQTQNSASIQLRALESIASSSRSIYEGLLSRLKEVQGQEGIATPDARIISRATEPTTASPRPAFLMGLAIPASLALGLLLAFLVEGIDPSIRTTEQVDKYLDLPMLGTVPEAKSQGGATSVSELIVDEPASSFAESIRGLHLNLSLADHDRAPKVLLITSAVPGEGKTVIAVSLARLAARNGRRVIVVDADFRRPAVARTMRLAAPAGGIVDVLEGRMPIERCVVTEVRSRTSILGGATRAVNPSDLLTSDALASLVATLRNSYDLIVIDSAPLLPVHDTLALVPHSDAVLFVTHSGKTSREAVSTALRSLKSMRAAVAGIALTRAKIDPRYSYHDYLHGAFGASHVAPTPRALPAPKGVLGRLRDLVIKAEDAGPRSGQ